MARWLGKMRFAAWLHRTEEEGGQGLAEYALIIALVGLACVAGLTGLGGAIASSAGFTSLPMSI